MPRGGKRPGAGRKPGPQGERKKTTARRKVAAEAAAKGISPLDVMLEAMRALHKAKNLVAAASIARDAAPYVHARLSAVAHSGAIGVQLQVVEEIIDAGDGAQAGAAAPGPAGVPAI